MTPVSISVLPNHLSQTGKIMLQMGKKFCHHIGVVYVTCSNILKMGIRMGTMKSLGRTLSILRKAPYFTAAT